MTAQIHEILILDGRQTSMAFCPPLPKDHPRVIEIDREKAWHDPQTWKDGANPILFSTGCWRGYQGTWEIVGQHFYLVGLRGRYRILGEQPILADWFSGVLRISAVESLQFAKRGFGIDHEEEIYVEVVGGKIVTAQG
jgi:hypothetical protein